MSKQLLFMVAMTLVGTGGALFYGFYWSAFVYFLFAVLRPQFFWSWSLPDGIAWSFYVSLPAIFGALQKFGETNKPGQGWSRIHFVIFCFFSWMVVSYINAVNQNVAYPWLILNLKIGLMFFVGSLLISTPRQAWLIYLMTATALGYIGYEVNFYYFVDGRMNLRDSGLCGYDNNGGGLMLAMTIPLCLYAWEALQSRWRWLFAAFVPLLVHTVLLSFSRGAMLAVVCTTPLIVWRSRYRAQMTAATILFGVACLPAMTGKEVRARFFSIEKSDADNSAQSRFSTWGAAYRMSLDYPIFGVGVRNSSYMVGKYGHGSNYQTIHSQYLQLLADDGYPGLLIYLSLLAVTFIGLARARGRYQRRTDVEAKQALSAVNGIECALFTFCFGAIFLSLETFEVTYVLFMLAARFEMLSHVIAVVPLPNRTEPFQSSTTENQVVQVVLPDPVVNAHVP